MILIYREDKRDRWLPHDWYARELYKKVLRRKRRIFGQTRAFLNLCEGLRRSHIDFVVNPTERLVRESTGPLGVFGQANALDFLARFPDRPAMVGPALYAHPMEDPRLGESENIRKILVPCDWMLKMSLPYWGTKTCAWPVGIDTEAWSPAETEPKTVDFLVYDKLMWPDEAKRGLTQAVYEALGRNRYSFRSLRYGGYYERDYRELLKHCRGMIFLCEHETQGIAYQQALASGVPVCAWDPGGYWQDPSFYPTRVQFGPVTSVPYWDDRCGMKFRDTAELEEVLPVFYDKMMAGAFSSRQYVLEKLSLEEQAKKYATLYDACGI